VPSGSATYAAVAFTVAVAFGVKWAVWSRARKDLQGALNGVEKARQALAEAWWAFLAVSVVVVVVVKLWLNAKH
jgi:hypothetical protein